MRYLIIYFFAIFISFKVFSQSSTKSLTNTASLSTETTWDLNKFVWSHAQVEGKNNTKPVLDFAALDNRKSLNEYVSLSSDGDYFAYGINSGSKKRIRLDSIIVQSTKDAWRQSFAGAQPGFFSSKSRQYIFKDRRGLNFINLDTRHLTQDTNLIGGSRLLFSEDNEWLVWQQKNENVIVKSLITGFHKEIRSVSEYSFDESECNLVYRVAGKSQTLFVYNLVSNVQLRFDSVSSYGFSQNGGYLLLNRGNSLEYADLIGQNVISIWLAKDSLETIGDFSFASSGLQVAFLVKRRELYENTIWYWANEMQKSALIISNENPVLGKEFFIKGPLFFTDNGENIQFFLSSLPNFQKPDSRVARMDLWNYKDNILQSTQQKKLGETKDSRAVVHISSRFVLRLEDEFKRVKCLKDNYVVVVKSRKLIYGDRFWEKEYNLDSNWVISLKDGSLKKMFVLNSGDLFRFSPTGNFLIYNDSKQLGHYFSYELATGRLVDISPGLSAWKLSCDNRLKAVQTYPKYAAGIAAWLEADTAVLVYDNFDIWQLNLTGHKMPLNITNGYGYKNKIFFSLFNNSQPQSFEVLGVSSFLGKDTLILRAFNNQNKFNGFFLKILSRKGNPENLFMGPYFFSRLNIVDGSNDGMVPLKAKGKNAWIVQRQSATEAPNYYFTEDFRNYRQLTDLQPQVKYNWLTTEFHQFKQLDGTTGAGVLYKPENFDSTKKYSVIISFYGHLSDRPYQFPQPGYITQPSIFDDPTWMVSHGYLVFITDIYFANDQWGSGVMNSLEGAAKYLKQFSYVDKNSIGATGHSNSGRFAYYLFTHSNTFSAMSIGAGGGGIDIIDIALSHDNTEYLEWAESGAMGSGVGNLWSNKAVWIDHTGLIQADKANAPILISYNKKDNASNLGKGMFTALWRLEKKSWWLTYDDGLHVLGIKEDLQDFTIRYTQFFDHFLKGAPAPRWMTQGIPATLKGKETRFDLDPAGSCGIIGKTPCKICEAWNKQYKSNPAMFEKEIKDWKLDKDISNNIQTTKITKK